jgi:hypothetical protein
MSTPLMLYCELVQRAHNRCWDIREPIIFRFLSSSGRIGSATGFSNNQFGSQDALAILYLFAFDNLNEHMAQPGADFIKSLANDSQMLQRWYNPSLIGD